MIPIETSESRYNIIANMMNAGYEIVNGKEVMYSGYDPEFHKTMDFTIGRSVRKGLAEVWFNGTDVYGQVTIDEVSNEFSKAIKDNAFFTEDMSMADTDTKKRNAEQIDRFFREIGSSRMSKYATALRLQDLLERKEELKGSF